MSMREKYQSLALADLKEIAKSRGIKGTSGMKKADIIEAMVALDEEAEGRKKRETLQTRLRLRRKRPGAGVCLKSLWKRLPRRKGRQRSLLK